MKQVDFRSNRVAYNIAQTALPLLAAQVLHLLYNIVDRVYIGRIEGVGTQALGGVGLVFPVIIIITGFTNLFGLGGAPLFAIALGKGDRERAARILHCAFRLLLLSSCIIMVFCEIFAVPLLTLFGADEESLLYALPYTRIYLTGTVFTMLASGMNPFINAQGFPRVGMLTIAIGAVSNLLLDPLLIFVLQMGVRGAALATVLSQALSFAFSLRFFTGSVTMFTIRLFPAGEKLFPHAAEIIGLGFSSFVMQATNSLVQITCNNTLLQYGGLTYVSVMTVVSSVRSILDTPPLAISEGSAPLISFNYGAKHPDNIRRAVKIMTMISLSYTFVLWLFLELRAEWFVAVFSPDETLQLPASHAMRIYFRAFVFQALQYSGQSTFKALGFKKHTIFFSLFRKAVLVVPLIYLFSGPFGLGTDGVFYAEPVSNVVGGGACFTTMVLTLRGVLRNMREETQPPPLQDHNAHGGKRR